MPQQALDRLGFAFKRPKKRLVNESKREAFVAEYAALWEEAQRTPLLTRRATRNCGAGRVSRRWWTPIARDCYYSACLETGEVEWMELEGNSNSGTSVAFLTQLKEKHPGPPHLGQCASPP